MPKTDTNVSELVGMIVRGELRLPELQRHYVWTATRVRDLFDSLYRSYPSGAILVWETTDEVPERALAVEQGATPFATHKLLLDGQQRLTSLTAVLTRKPLHVKNRVRPIQIAFNLDHPDGPPTDVVEIQDDAADADGTDDESADGAGAETQSIRERIQDRTFVVGWNALFSDPRWIKVSDVFDDAISERQLIRPAVSSYDDPLYDKYAERIRKLRKILDYPYVMHVLDRDLSYEEVADIFVRVNSLGMKLRSSDLALAQITARWRGALELFEDFADECGRTMFSFDTGLLVRALVVFATGQSRFRTVNSISVERLKAGWRDTEAGLRFAINFLRTNAGIEDSALLSSTFLAIPIAVLGVERKYELDQDEERELLHWVFLANALGHYSGSGESTLDNDIAIIRRRAGGPNELLDELSRRYGRTRFAASDFTGRTQRSPLFATSYLAAKWAGAKDWQSGLGLSLSHSGPNHRIQVHHIFPRGAMRDVDQTLVNEIANLAFLSGAKNRSLSAHTPDQYLPDVLERRGPEALTAQGLPLDPSLWRKQSFPAFLDYRRAELADLVNRFLDQVATAGAATVGVGSLIEGGEGPAVEFKETARYNIASKQADKLLESMIVRTVAGFANASGGTLLIGVTDAGIAVGIDRDLKTLNRKDLDGYEQFLRTLLRTQLGDISTTRARITFPDVDGVTVCVIHMPASPTPMWIQAGPDRVFVARSGNTTQTLSGDTAHQYMLDRFHERR